jgi:hypothetical protein
MPCNKAAARAAAYDRLHALRDAYLAERSGRHEPRRHCFRAPALDITTLPTVTNEGPVERCVARAAASQCRQSRLARR